ncbi:MAG: YfhO family protein [Chloroflexi bacterium]|nr:YfhO family protein [Chloroflexota bacterium]
MPAASAFPREENPLKRFRQVDLALLLLIALTLLFFYRLAFTNLILARGDTFTYFYPYWGVRNAALLSGQLPLWSPDLFMGVPLLANSQLGTFYPPNWLVAPLSPPDGVRVSILLHVAFGSIGTYLLARRTLNVSRLAAVCAAALFAFSGHLGAHVEQINQLQGLAWLPWLIYLLDRALERPLPNTLLLGMGIALQFFTGHTQTVFITAVALGIYALCQRPVRGLITLAVGGLIALLLAVPQLIPTLEMASVSNRRGGLNINQATAFSFSPFVTGRGLLPSYDSLIFGEYVAYPGVIGLGLAIVGALSSVGARRGATSGCLPLQKIWRIRLPLSPRATWLMIALVGLAFAYGLYNPIYWLIGTLPGFDLFRVPARWLALFVLGIAMLAGLGVDAIRDTVGAHTQVRLQPLSPVPSPTQAGRGEKNRRVYVAIVIIIGGLAVASALTLRQNDQTPISLPTPITLAGWAIALLVLLIGVWRRKPVILAGALLLELWCAAQIMPYNQLVPPDAYSAQRFTESQLIADDQGQTPPGRVLSISNLLFDPGDRAALEAQYTAAGLSKEATALAFDTVKLRETIGANLPLQYGIQSVDGYDGGLLPTAYYTAFTSLFLPQGELRTVDGRLREILAKPECGGACIPDSKWLNLMGVRYLVTDKIYDLVNDGIFYDTQFATAGGIYANVQNFTANAVDVLCNPCGSDLRVQFGSKIAELGDSVPVGNFTRQRYTLPEAITGEAVQISDALGSPEIDAVTLVDTRTGDFQQLTPDPWTRVLSSDIKMYQTYPTVPRAFVVHEVYFPNTSDAGTEAALEQMQMPTFDPLQTAFIAHDFAGEARGFREDQANSSVVFTHYADTQVSLSVDSPTAGYLVLTDAYYPGWTATVNGVDTPVERADVMFRAVKVPAGQNEVVFEYRPAWLPIAPIVGGAAWVVGLIAWVVLRILGRTAPLKSSVE